MHIKIVLYILLYFIKFTIGTFICTNDGMFENPDNYRTFWQCTHGNSYLKPCPTNLIWSQLDCQCIQDDVPTDTLTTISSTTTETTLSTTESLPTCSYINLITFENASTYSKIPNDYYGLKWTNVYALDTLIYPQWSGSGFYSARKSGTWVAFNMNGERMTISIDPPKTFSIKSFIASSAWEDSVILSMISQRASTYYKEASFKIEKNRSTTIELNWFDINTITFYASTNTGKSGEVFVIDNLCLDSTTTTTEVIPTQVIDKCPINEVLYENHCYFLDGIGGQCPSGYSLGSEIILSRITNSFIGLNYKTAISDNCCVITSDDYSNYGINSTDQCNKQGPFTTVPVLNGGGCKKSTNKHRRQLTFCVSN